MYNKKTSPYHDGIRPSPIFYLVVAITAFGIWVSAAPSAFPIDPKVGVFLMVTGGWILSLIFHEFAHAYVAWKGGDLSVAAKGYLTLNPLKYAHPVLSIVLPVILVMIGGIGLPGGAVWIDNSRLSDERQSAVSAAGPFASLLCAIVCIAPLLLGLMPGAPVQILPEGSAYLVTGLVFLAAIEIISVVINLLPIPGLDGFGILEPTLSPSLRASLAPFQGYGIMILFVLIFWTPVGRYLWAPVESIFSLLNIEFRFFHIGYELYRFWE